MGLFDSILLVFIPIYTKPSYKWRTWKTMYDPKVCLECLRHQGTIYRPDATIYPSPQLHYNCRCWIDWLDAVMMGEATMEKMNGADVYLAMQGCLPPEHYRKSEAKQYGWKSRKGNLREVLPDATIGGDVYLNDDRRLPDAYGRVWRETDINYQGGYRGLSRIVYSNDGLMFATYDHYATFVEIIKGDGAL